VNHDWPATLGNRLQLLHYVPLVLGIHVRWRVDRLELKLVQIQAVKRLHQRIQLCRTQSRKLHRLGASLSQHLQPSPKIGESQGTGGESYKPHQKTP
jgi:hypothetical protein